MNKPIIGIVAKHYKGNDTMPDTFIRDEMKQAIFDNNAIAIGILPPNFEKISCTTEYEFNSIEKENIIEQINLCDGIILQGGLFSDKYETFIAKYCYEKNIPILGICAGNNNIVRGVNGKVNRNSELPHNSKEKYVHEIEINPKSLLFKIIQKEKVMVNSRHTSFIEKTSLLISANSPDGIIEAVECSTKTFYMGLQFHPESLYKTDENMNSIFKYFINICKK